MGVRQRQRIVGTLGDLHGLHRNGNRLIELIEAPIHHRRSQHSLAHQVRPIHAFEHRHAVLDGRHHIVEHPLIDRVQGHIQVRFGLADAIAAFGRQIEGRTSVCRCRFGQRQIGFDA